MNQDARQTGRTTAQMQAAPKGALYVWPNAQLGYPRDLAESLGRTDLEIISAGRFRWDTMRGKRVTGCVVDHAVRYTQSVRDALAEIRRNAPAP